LIKWKGFDHGVNTWEPVHDLISCGANCADALEEFRVKIFGRGQRGTIDGLRGLSLLQDLREENQVRERLGVGIKGIAFIKILEHAIIG
jgi:hypothetical protein